MAVCRFVLPYTVEEILGTQLRVLEPLLKVGILERRPDIVEVPAESWSDAVLVEERLNSLPYNVSHATPMILPLEIVKCHDKL